MKHISKLVLTVFILSVCKFNHAQISPKFYGTAKDFKAMANRTLIVELMEVDIKTVAKLSKKEKAKNEDKLKEYEAFIDDYNRMMQDAVAKYWKFNTKIEYKKSSEIQKLTEAKDTGYVKLTYFELSDVNVSPADLRSGETVPALMLQRLEQKNIDYMIYFPSSFARNDNKYFDCDYKFALVYMQANINWIIKNNKVMHFNDYADKLAASNCSKLKNLTLLVDKDYLKKGTSEAEAKKVYGENLNFVATDELNKSYTGGEQGKAVLFSIPCGITKSEMPYEVTILTYFKVIVSCETNEILWVHSPGHMPIEENVDYTLIKSELQKIANCKF